MKQCQILLEEPDLETAVRVGDVYGVMIEHLAREENYSKVCANNFLVIPSSLLCLLRSQHVRRV